jgi:hypothetical protein
LVSNGSREIDRELDSGERVLWSGNPRTGVVLRRIDLLLIPFSVFWTGFIVVWIVGVVASHAPAFFVAFSAPFVAFAVYLLVGRFLVDSWIRGHTHYAVTNTRVIIVTTFFGRRLQSVQLANLAEITLIEGTRGFGSIRFGQQFPFLSMLQGWPGASLMLPPCLDSVPNARAVLQTLREAQRGTQS